MAHLFALRGRRKRDFIKKFSAAEVDLNDNLKYCWDYLLSKFCKVAIANK